jgi:hypothetical protein
MYKTFDTARKHLIDGENFANRKFDYLRGNVEFVEFAIKENTRNIPDIADKLWEDKGFVLHFLSRIAPTLDIRKTKIKNPENWLDVITTQKLNSTSKTREIFDDKEVVKAYVALTGSFYKLKSEFTNDPELFKLALSVDYHNPYNYKEAGSLIKNDIELTKLAVSKSPYAYQNAPEELKTNRDVALVAFTSGTPLTDLPEVFRNDKEIFTACLNSDEITINSSSEFKTYPLLNNVEFIKDFINTCNENKIKRLKDEVDYFDPFEKEPRFFGPEVYSICGENIKNNKEITLTVLKSKPYFIRLIGEDLLSDRDVIFEAVKRGQMPNTFHSSLSNDKELLIRAIEIDKENLRFASDSLKDDNKFVLKCAQLHGEYFGSQSIKHASRRIRDLVGTQNPEPVLKSEILKEKLHQSLQVNNQTQPKKPKL